MYPKNGIINIEAKNREKIKNRRKNREIKKIS